MATQPADDQRRERLPRQAPGVDDPQDAPKRRAPGSPDAPDTIDAPPSDEDAPDGAVGVDPEDAHVGATEEQVSDRTGPGVGYDEGTGRR